MTRVQGTYVTIWQAARTLLPAFILCLTFSTGAPAAQPEAAQNPRAFVEALGAEVLAVIQAQNIAMPERQKRFRALFLQAFDVPKIGRFVVGRHWSRATADEQAKYLEVFGSYVSTIYASQFSNYQGEAFKTTGARQIGDDESIVQSEIGRGANPPIQLSFRVNGTPGSFKITDVTVENVSLIITKRDEFGPVLTQEGMSGATKRMQVVVDQGAGKS
jgi:phospholipid transport system substrate-binding protein